MRLVSFALSIVIVAAAAGGCDGVPTAEPITVAPGQQAILTLDNTTAACAITKAWGGLGSPIPQLSPCTEPASSYTGLPSGSSVTTDTCGQAWLQTQCGKLYVLHGTRFLATKCDPAGNELATGCVTTGTAAWSSSNCPAEVKMATLSASITLEGTWFSTTYIEDRQISVFIVLEGTGSATPFVDVDGQQEGDPSPLEGGQFWFSAPGPDAPVVAGVEGRTAQPLQELPAVARELGIESWVAAVVDRAERDGIDVSGVPDIPVVNVRLAGGRLDDTDTRVAVITALDWNEAAARTLPDDGRPLTGLGGDDPPVDLRAALFDPEFARATVTEQGALSVRVIWQPGGDLDALVELLVEALTNVGIDATAEPADSQDAAATAFGAIVGEQQAAIWLTDR